jgi:hypothetical protein
MNKCENCGEDTKNPKFCSRSCSASYNNKNRKHSQETKDKIGRSLKGWQTISGGKIKPETFYIMQICPICKNEIIIETTAPSSISKTKTCSDKCFRTLLSIKTIESGCGGFREGSGRSIGGYYKGIYCHSTYELIFLVYHLDIGTKIKRSKKQIPYSYESKNHIYYPDFEIDGKLVEIKGFYNDVVGVKTQAAKDLGYNINVLYLSDLNPMIDYLKKKFKFSNVMEFYEDPPYYKHICKNCNEEFKNFKKDSIFCSRKCAGKYSKFGHKYKDKKIASSNGRTYDFQS